MPGNKLPLYFLLAVGFCLAASIAGAETIDTIVFPEPASDASRLLVGPEGDIWFTLADPGRLMRIRDDRLECVYDSGLMGKPARDIAITPDGRIWLDHCLYIYTSEGGVQRSDVRDHTSQWHWPKEPASIDADCRKYLVFYNGSMYPPYRRNNDIWEVVPGGGVVRRYEDYGIDCLLVISATECWADLSSKQGVPVLGEINLETGTLEGVYWDYYYPRSECPIYPFAMDSAGLLWAIWGPNIVTFDREAFSIFALGDGDMLDYYWPRLTADGTLWVSSCCGWGQPGLARFRDTERRLFASADGLLTDLCSHPAIDHDGRVWMLNWDEGPEDYVGLSIISDGGWPPMRLMLHEVATEGTIAVEAQVINNGPVVGVDVYIAIELNGQLLYWPNWQPEPYANQINLRPGHNQTATIIEARCEDVPPGSYTFWGCMTGRNTSKLIGPIDRKFESLAIKVESR